MVLGESPGWMRDDAGVRPASTEPGALRNGDRRVRSVGGVWARTTFAMRGIPSQTVLASSRAWCALGSRSVGRRKTPVLCRTMQRVNPRVFRARPAFGESAGWPRRKSVGLAGAGVPGVSGGAFSIGALGIAGGAEGMAKRRSTRALRRGRPGHANGGSVRRREPGEGPPPRKVGASSRSGSRHIPKAKAGMASDGFPGSCCRPRGRVSCGSATSGTGLYGCFAGCAPARGDRHVWVGSAGRAAGAGRSKGRARPLVRQGNPSAVLHRHITTRPRQAAISGEDAQYCRHAMLRTARPASCGR